MQEERIRPAMVGSKEFKENLREGDAEGGEERGGESNERHAAARGGGTVPMAPSGRITPTIPLVSFSINVLNGDSLLESDFWASKVVKT